MRHNHHPETQPPAVKIGAVTRRGRALLPPAVCPEFHQIRRQVEKFCTDNALVNQQVVVGFSGGADSLVLLVALRVAGIATKAVIVDHGLQDDSAIFSARAVETAQLLGADATIVRVDVPTGSPDGVEAAARHARYQALREQAQILTADSSEHSAPVLVAHHRNDQVETLLLSLLRGQLSPMQPVHNMQSMTVYRPLLAITRDSIEQAIIELELGEYVFHDPMNEDPAYRRVALRKQLIPQLSELIGGDVVASLGELAGEIGDDNSYFAALSAELLTQYLEPGEPYPGLSLKVAAEPPSVRRRIFYQWLHRLGFQPSKAVIAGIDQLSQHPHARGAVAVGHSPQRVRLSVVRDSHCLKVQAVN